LDGSLPMASPTMCLGRHNEIDHGAVLRKQERVTKGGRPGAAA
jgi:hypothetical protein